MNLESFKCKKWELLAAYRPADEESCHLTKNATLVSCARGQPLEERKPRVGYARPQSHEPGAAAPRDAHHSGRHPAAPGFPPAPLRSLPPPVPISGYSTAA